ncbi:MAG: UDP-2,3-diacylglucosamine diphosphatase [Porticoccaceae bacterium]|nr:UDP-2,3-diacylglucosamine diphosphatase [Porticoccaceae bacterium]
MTDLLISDLHLSPERPAITRAFFDFLDNRARQARGLYILGDLVEAWIGDDDPDQLSRDLVARLRNLSDSGTGLYIQHGNRDFLMGKRFARETGATLLGDYHIIENPEYASLGRILLCHGDTLCSDDVDYQRFRRKVRRPLNRWLLAHLPLKKRQAIARKWRNQSSAANSNKADNIMDVNGDTVAEVMLAYKAKTLIHGHTHRPGIHDNKFGKRVVLGDWAEQGWYASLEDGGVKLDAFAITT